MLFKDYKTRIIPKLQKELGVKNPLALPQVTRVVINMRVVEDKGDQKAMDEAIEELKLITGQKPKLCRAKKSVSGFRLREGEPIGLKATLRRKKMYDFLDKLFFLVLPRLRDFRGLAISQFDQQGNFNIGMNDQRVFPEINIDKVKRTRGLQVTIITSTRDREESRFLLEVLGLPFVKESG